MAASLPLVRNGHFFFSPTPFSTPPSTPLPSPFSTPLSAVGEALSSSPFSSAVGEAQPLARHVEIFVGRVAEVPGWTVPRRGDTGGPNEALADEVADAEHLPHCGCYWCLRQVYLQLYFDRPDDPL